MGIGCRKPLLVALAVQQGLGGIVLADGLFDRFKAGRHSQLKQEYHAKEVHHGPPYDLSQIAGMVDVVEEGVLDDGTVVAKRPDVWSQARMTKYRIDFEQQMKEELNKFSAVISARMARTDQASFESATSLGAALSGVAPGGGAGAGPAAAATPSKDVLDAQANLVKAQADADTAQSKLIDSQTAQNKQNIAMLGNQDKVNPVQVDAAKPFGLLDSTGTALAKISDALGGGKLGLEPTVYLDEKKRYLDHLNELRRVNLGDDTADSAGYSMTLIRMPISIQPGEKTKKGHGAVFNVTARPDFPADFLPVTFRNLVTQDVVDQFTPILFEVLDRDLDKKQVALIAKRDALQKQYAETASKFAQLKEELKKLEEKQYESQMAWKTLEDTRAARVLLAKADHPLVKVETKANLLTEANKRISDLTRHLDSSTMAAEPKATVVDLLKSAKDATDPKQKEEYLKQASETAGSKVESLEPLANNAVSDLRSIATEYDVSPSVKNKDFNLLGLDDSEFDIQRNQMNIGLKKSRSQKEKRRKELEGRIKQIEPMLAQTQTQLAEAQLLVAAVQANIPANRMALRPYPIAPTDMGRVFLGNNLLVLASKLRNSRPTQRSTRAADVRAFLYQVMEAAYDLSPAYETMIDEITTAVKAHAYNALPEMYSRLAGLLPGDLQYKADDPVAILSWAIAVDAGLLDLRLKEEMARLSGRNGFQPDCDPAGLFFYLSQPQPEAVETFQNYVNTRWPIICFALDPVVDQQNVADAFSMRRDLQLAVSFAFSTGQINFNQFNRFRRRLELDAETIALNRTVTTFAHGNETFGWRFYPRYQTPPQEGSNVQVIANQLWRGGPGRDYQVRNSRLEPGQRELTTVLIVPSFLTRVRFEAMGNWFPLTQPDDYTVPTARMVWQGEQVQKLRHAATHYCDPRATRPGDLERVLVKIDRVEQMLPMQTETVDVPYENAQGGFDLFTPGLASLVPELFGYDGVDLAEPGQDASFFVFGKNFSIHETKVVAGGRKLADDSVELLSREVLRVTVPGTVLPTVLTERDGRTFIEVVAATPNGISNRLAVPIKPAEKAAAAASGYTWADPPAYNAFARFNNGGNLAADAGAADPPFWFQESPDAEIVVNSNPSLNDGDDKAPALIPKKITHMAMRLTFKDKAGNVLVKDAGATKPRVKFEGTSQVTKAKVPAKANIQDPIQAVLVKELTETNFGDEITIRVDAFILVDGSPTTIKLDDPFTVTVRVRPHEPTLDLPPKSNQGEERR